MLGMINPILGLFKSAGAFGRHLGVTPEARAGSARAPQRGSARAAARISSSEGILPSSVRPLAHSMFAQRTMPVGHRRAEYGHDRVAHELLHEAVIARDRLGQRVEARRLEGAHHLGVE